MAKTKIKVRMQGMLFVPGGPYPCEMTCVATVDIQVVAVAKGGGTEKTLYARTPLNEARSN